MQTGEDQERLDVVILGASGFTGKYVVREMLKFRDDGRGGTRRIGLAGRSQKKVKSTLIWAAGSIAGGYPGLLSEIPILEADVCCPDSLTSLCKQTRLLISCVGPYSKYGRPVVAACVEAGIDYLDISGEPHFMEAMELQYHQQAVSKRSLVVSACGYDSIPAEMGVLYTTKELVRRGWTPNSVDSYLLGASKDRRGRALVNYGTYESLILSLANTQSLGKLRRAAVPNSVPRPRPKIPGVAARKPGMLQWEENSKTWAIKLPVADASVVRRTQSTVASHPDGVPTPADDVGCNCAPIDDPNGMTRQQKWKCAQPAHYGCYLSSKSCINLLALILMATLWAFLAKLSWGKRCLLRYPELFSLGIFSKDGPSEELINNTYFSMWFVGRGYSKPAGHGMRRGDEVQQQQPDKVIVTRISGPEMGYLTTSICLVQAALVVLDARAWLPKGGVFTPGAVFATTDLQERLHTNGLRFQMATLEQHEEASIS